MLVTRVRARGVRRVDLTLNCEAHGSVTKSVRL